MKASGKTKTNAGHGWMYYARGSAQIAFLIAAFKFIELLIVPPLADEPRWLVAGVVSFKFWGAGAALGLLWLLGRVSQRLFGWPAPEAPPEAQPPTRPVVQTEAMRLQTLGNKLVLWWFILGFLAIVMMADTGAGPIPRLMKAVVGPSDWLALETFVLGLPLLAAPLVLLALLPWQTRFPLLASLQKAVKPAHNRTRARTRGRKRP